MFCLKTNCQVFSKDALRAKFSCLQPSPCCCAHVCVAGGRHQAPPKILAAALVTSDHKSRRHCPCRSGRRRRGRRRAGQGRLPPPPSLLTWRQGWALPKLGKGGESEEQRKRGVEVCLLSQHRPPHSLSLDGSRSLGATERRCIHFCIALIRHAFIPLSSCASSCCARCSSCCSFMTLGSTAFFAIRRVHTSPFCFFHSVPAASAARPASYTESSATGRPFPPSCTSRRARSKTVSARACSRAVSVRARALIVSSGFRSLSSSSR